MSDESEELDLESDGNDESDITFKEPLPSSDDEGLHLEKEKEQQGGDPRVEQFDLIENILLVQKRLMKQKADHISPHARKKSKKCAQVNDVRHVLVKEAEMASVH